MVLNPQLTNDVDLVAEALVGSRSTITYACAGVGIKYDIGLANRVMKKVARCKSCGVWEKYAKLTTNSANQVVCYHGC